VALKDGYSIKKAKREIEQVLGVGYVIQDRYEQQEDFFQILRIEKLLTALLSKEYMSLSFLRMI
jgi:lipoprotein-releasing system permease protein